MKESRIPPRCLAPSFSYSVELLLWGKKKVRKWKLINYFRQLDAHILANCPRWVGFSGKGQAGIKEACWWWQTHGVVCAWVLMSTMDMLHMSSLVISSCQCVSRVRNRSAEPYPNCFLRPSTSTSSPSCVFPEITSQASYLPWSLFQSLIMRGENFSLYQ